MPKTATERKREERERRRAKGLVRVECWVLESNRGKLRAVEQALQGKFNDCCIESGKITILIEEESE